MPCFRVPWTMEQVSYRVTDIRVISNLHTDNLPSSSFFTSTTLFLLFFVGVWCQGDFACAAAGDKGNLFIVPLFINSYRCIRYFDNLLSSLRRDGFCRNPAKQLILFVLLLTMASRQVCLPQTKSSFSLSLSESQGTFNSGQFCHYCGVKYLNLAYFASFL